MIRLASEEVLIPDRHSGWQIEYILSGVCRSRVFPCHTASSAMTSSLDSGEGPSSLQPGQRHTDSQSLGSATSIAFPIVPGNPPALSSPVTGLKRGSTLMRRASRSLGRSTPVPTASTQRVHMQPAPRLCPASVHLPAPAAALALKELRHRLVGAADLLLGEEAAAALAALTRDGIAAGTHNVNLGAALVAGAQRLRDLLEREALALEEGVARGEVVLVGAGAAFEAVGAVVAARGGGVGGDGRVTRDGEEVRAGWADWGVVSGEDGAVLKRPMKQRETGGEMISDVQRSIANVCACAQAAVENVRCATVGMDDEALEKMFAICGVDVESSDAGSVGAISGRLDV